MNAFVVEKSSVTGVNDIGVGQPSARKKLLEINFLRPLVIFLIVVLHSFTMYTGGWPLPEGIERNYFYMAIAKLSHSCVLETFVLMSSFLWAFSICELGKKSGFVSLVKKKFLRLIIPAMVFGVLYQWIVEDISPTLTLSYWGEILTGVAHLWFLPMLFWCFVLTFFLLKWRVSNRIKLLLLGCLCIAPFNDLPLQMGQVTYYWLFFYLGWLFRIHHVDWLSQQAQPRHLLKFACFFIVTFAAYSVFREFLSNFQLGVVGEAAVKQMLLHASRMVSSLFGVYLLMLFAFYIKSRYEIPVWWLRLNSYCFGIN